MRGTGPGARSLAFFGDLCMRPWSANPRWVTAFDDFPLDSVEVKGELFRRAVEDDWTVVLSHEARMPVGKLVPGPGPLPVRGAVGAAPGMAPRAGLHPTRPASHAHLWCGACCALASGARRGRV